MWEGQGGLSDGVRSKLRGGVSLKIRELRDRARHWRDGTPLVCYPGQRAEPPRPCSGRGAGGGRRRRALVGTQGAAGMGGSGGGAGCGCWPEHLLPGGSHSGPAPPTRGRPRPCRLGPRPSTPHWLSLEARPRPYRLATPLPTAASGTQLPEATVRTLGFQAHVSHPSPVKNVY